MPTGQPDSIEGYSDRLIRDAMEAGEFDELLGAGQPIPGAGTKDDAGWWIRSWIERNREPGNQDSSSSR
ncbi:MAG TPA: DnaJ family domain-containing protein [Acidimicrobiia bacterium]